MTKSKKVDDRPRDAYGRYIKKADPPLIYNPPEPPCRDWWTFAFALGAFACSAALFGAYLVAVLCR